MTGKLRSVQALRAVAVMLVVWAHISTPFGFETRYIGGSRLTRWMHFPAAIGVDLFFVISGVIILTTAWPAFSTAGAWRQFLYRRATRIYPPYLIVTALVLIVFLVRPGVVNSHDVHRPEILPSLLILPQRGDPLLAVGWTLVYELYFYAVFTLALLFARRRLPWIVGGWAAATLALHLLVGHTTNAWLFVASNPINLEFVLGVCVGYLIVRGALAAPRVLLAGSLLALTGLLGQLGISSAADFPSAAYRVGAVGAALALLVYASVGMELIGRARAPRLLERIGDASYSVYLWHVPVMAVAGLALERVFPAPVPFHALALLLAFALAVSAGIVVYEWVERPLLRALHTRRLGGADAEEAQRRRWRWRARAAI